MFNDYSYYQQFKNEAVERQEKARQQNLKRIRLSAIANKLNITNIR